MRVPFGRTRPGIARRMLEDAGVTGDSVVLDVGSGAGDILVEAAALGARAIGIEMDRLLAAESKRRAEIAGLGRRVEVIEDDFLSAKIPKADVVTLYLTRDANAAVARRLLAELPLARVVAHRFPVPGWKPLEVDEYGGTRIYVYVPALSATWGRTSRLI
ncbi:MAG: SAM-dependent methyltransferase [Nitrososphaeria archaeon]